MFLQNTNNVVTQYVSPSYTIRVELLFPASANRF